MLREFAGRPSYQENDRYGIVVSRYNESVTRRLLDGAIARFAELGVPEDALDVVWVPGAWELPLVTEWVASRGVYASIVALGCVIRGETTHDEHINRHVSLALGEIARKAGIPIPFGLLTCGSMDQALQRSGGTHGNKGSDCAEVALELVDLARHLSDLR